MNLGLNDVLSDLQTAGFTTNFVARGQYETPRISEVAAKERCDKLLSMGYEKQGDDLYPLRDEDGGFGIQNADTFILIDYTNGYIYLT